MINGKSEYTYEEFKQYMKNLWGKSYVTITQDSEFEGVFIRTIYGLTVNTIIFCDLEYYDYNLYKKERNYWYTIENKNESHQFGKYKDNKYLTSYMHNPDNVKPGDPNNEFFREYLLMAIISPDLKEPKIFKVKEG